MPTIEDRCAIPVKRVDASTQDPGEFRTVLIHVRTGGARAIARPANPLHRAKWIVVSGLLAVIEYPGWAPAQEFPGSRPIRILASQSGGGGDIVARLIAEQLATTLGQRGIVDARGILAPEIARKAPPDGDTIVIYSTPFWLQPLLREHVPWDPIKDFLPITLAANAPNVLVVHASLAVKSTQELIDLARAKPGELNYGSGSTGSSSHLAAELFNSMAGIRTTRIAYKGVAPALTGLAGGEVHFVFSSVAAAAPFLRTGKTRALATATARRTALLPNVPTLAESGVPGYQADTPIGVFAPAKTPRAVINRLNQAIVAALRTSEVSKAVLESGWEVVGSSPEEFAATLKAEIARWGKLIREKNIREE